MLPGKIFGLFYMYGLMIAIGILIAIGLLFYYGKKKKIEEKFIDFVFYDAIISIIFCFFSAALFQGIYNYIDNPEAGFRLDGGLTFIGGLIGAVVCFITVYMIFRKRYKENLLEVLVFAPSAIAIGHAFGRLGGLFAGFCYGKETDSFLGVQFPNLPHPVHPTQLYEAAFLLILFAVTFYLLMKKDFKHNASVYLIGYGIWRFLIEFVRDDSRGQFVAGLTPSQFWSAVMVVLGVALIFVVEWLYKRRAAKAALQAVEEKEEIQQTEETEAEQ